MAPRKGKKEKVEEAVVQLGPGVKKERKCSALPTFMPASMIHLYM